VHGTAQLLLLLVVLLVLVLLLQPTSRHLQSSQLPGRIIEERQCAHSHVSGYVQLYRREATRTDDRGWGQLHRSSPVTPGRRFI